MASVETQLVVSTYIQQIKYAKSKIKKAGFST